MHGEWVSDMVDGQVAYVLPWAIYFSHGGALALIRGDYPIENEQSGAYTLRIVRHGQFFYADLSQLDMRNDGYGHPAWDMRRVLRM